MFRWNICAHSVLISCNFVGEFYVNWEDVCLMLIPPPPSIRTKGLQKYFSRALGSLNHDLIFHSCRLASDSMAAFPERSFSLFQLKQKSINSSASHNIESFYRLSRIAQATFGIWTRGSVCLLLSKI